MDMNYYSKPAKMALSRSTYPDLNAKSLILFSAQSAAGNSCYFTPFDLVRPPIDW